MVDYPRSLLLNSWYTLIAYHVCLTQQKCICIPLYLLGVVTRGCTLFKNPALGQLICSYSCPESYPLKKGQYILCAFNNSGMITQGYFSWVDDAHNCICLWSCALAPCTPFILGDLCTRTVDMHNFNWLELSLFKVKIPATFFALHQEGAWLPEAPCLDIADISCYSGMPSPQAPFALP